MNSTEKLKFLFENAEKLNLTFLNARLSYSGTASKDIKRFFQRVDDESISRIEKYPDENSEKYEFIIDVPRLTDGYFFKDIDDFINIIYSRTTDLPYYFAIYDGHILIDDKSKLDSYKQIKCILTFHNFLCLLHEYDILDIFEPTKIEIKLSDKKITMQMKSNVDKSAFINPEELIESISLIRNELEIGDNYKKEKILILKKALINFIEAVPSPQIINHVATHIKELQQRFSHNLELFITKFDFEDEEEKLLSELKTYQISLVSALSSIQSQLYAIPIAITLFISQIKYDQTTKYISLINGAILIAAVMVSTISCFLLQTQKASVKKIKDEIDKKNKRIKINVPNIYKSIENNFIDLDCSYKKVRSIIKIINCFNIISFLIILALVIWFTPKTHCWLVPCTAITNQESTISNCNVNMPIYNFINKY